MQAYVTDEAMLSEMVGHWPNGPTVGVNKLNQQQRKTLPSCRSALTDARLDEEQIIQNKKIESPSNRNHEAVSRHRSQRDNAGTGGLLRKITLT